MCVPTKISGFKCYLIAGLVLLSMQGVIGQSGDNEYTLSGYVRDEATGEELLYVNIAVEGTSIGAYTNNYGFYSVQIPEGTQKINYSYVGYDSQIITIDIDNDKSQDVDLSISSELLSEVVLTDEKTNEKITNTEVSTIALKMKEIENIPLVFGEQDVIKVIQLMPGISTTTEGGAGFIVRGGRPDQNLILIDEAPIFNPSHIFGFFSVFNSDALKDSKIYKGGMPARYGGRLSSVLDIRMKEGNMKEWSSKAGIGLLSSRILVEGPFEQDQGSMMLSARGTYFDSFLKLADRLDSDDFLFFYDVNFKANYKFGESDRVYLSTYYGQDVFSQSGAGLEWRNLTTTLRWSHIFSPTLFSNFTSMYSNYSYGIQAGGGSSITLESTIQTFTLKPIFTYYKNQSNTLEFGIELSYYIFEPAALSEAGKVTDKNSQTQIQTTSQRRTTIETGTYISHSTKIGDLSLEYGLRISSMSLVGAFDEKEYDDDNQPIKTESFGDNELYKTYFGFEPRLNLNYTLSDIHSIKASYNRNYQYLHRVSNFDAGTPIDIWFPVTLHIEPAIADQVAVGYFRNLFNNQYETSLEVFYKASNHILDYEDGSDVFSQDDLESRVIAGKGRSYGMEFFLKKRKGVFTGWLSYTLLKSELSNSEIMNGAWYPSRFDRTHDLSISLQYQWTNTLSFSTNFVFRTGDAVTLPSGIYQFQGFTYNEYSERNQGRYPAYHRLDMGVQWQMVKSDTWSSQLVFSVFNVYNRRNAFSYEFRENESSGRQEILQTSLFGAVPAITWNIGF